MFKRILVVVATAVAVASIFSTAITTKLFENAHNIETEAPKATTPVLPLTFVENLGQIDGDAEFYGGSRQQQLFFNRSGYKVRFHDGNLRPERSHVVEVSFVGSTEVTVENRSKADGIVSYFKGNPEEWKTNIPTHTQIGYRNLWAGVDLVYDGRSGKLESIYTIAPGADVSQIRLQYIGQDDLNIDNDGNLTYGTSVGELRETRPVAWQNIDGERISVPTEFEVYNNTVGFRVSPYDKDHELIIDPTLVYASYLGGTSNDRGADVAVDGSGNLYVTGETASSEATFPVTTGPDTTQNGSVDAYVAKFNSTGTSLIYCGYIGGSGSDHAYSIAVDASGNAYIAGETTSGTGFPATTGPDTSYNGGSTDAFVAKVNSSGTALTYAGFIGGSDTDYAIGVAVDGSGNAYVSGTTSSTEGTFPETVGPDLTHNGGTDAFIAKVAANGASLEYAGYIGGSSNDNGGTVAVDTSGYAFIVGHAISTEATFPVSVGPDLTFNGNDDAFVAKVDTDGDSLIYAGYIGGTQIDEGYDIALDSAGCAYITGRTSSSNGFPGKVGPDLTINSPGGLDAFVAKVKPDGTDLIYAGYIGGSGTEYGRNIAVDRLGAAYISGQSDTSDGSFPTINGPDSSYNGGDFDAFVTKVLPSGRGLVYSGFIGGSSGDIARGIAVDNSLSAYLTGNTPSSESTFPDGDGFGSVGGFDQTYSGSGDAWVAKVTAMPAPTMFDYDADGLSDVSVYRPSTGYWYLERSTSGSFNTQFGNSTDQIAPGDYDGDGKTDLAVFRESNGTWYRYFMGSGSNDSVSWGTSGDIAAPGDFDADGIDDVAVYRGSNSTDWYIKRSTDAGTTSSDFGVSGDKPVVGDYDGDGTADTAVYRPSDDTWYIQRSSKGYFALQWGSNNDLIAPADYDGDGFTDIAVFRPSNGTWYRYFMRTGTNDSVSYGTSGDIPAPGDYDGDGIDDTAVFRPSTGYWWLNRSRDGSTSVSFGSSGDMPTQGAFVRCISGC